MLVLLMGPWVVRTASGGSSSQRELAGRVGVAAMLAFTGMAHFLRPEMFTAMIPPSLPARSAAVYLSGAAELALGLAVLHARSRRLASAALLALLVLLLPVNVWAATQHIPVGGHAWGPLYLLVRVPLQLLVAGWVWRFGSRTT